MNSIVDKFLRTSIVYIFCIILFLITVLNIFYSRSYRSIEQATPSYFNQITLLIAIVLNFLLYRNHNKILNTLEKFHSSFLPFSLLMLSVIFQIITIQLFNVNPSWDFKVLLDQAKILVEGGGFVEYFIQYPNNILVVLILEVIGKFVSTELVVYQLFNIIFIAMSQYLIFRLASKLLGRNIGTICLIISIFFVPYILYAPIVYTDTISLVFVLLPLNIIMEQNCTLTTNIIRLVTASILLAIGILLKGSFVIFTIALSIVLFIHLKRWKKLFVLIPLICFFIVNTLFHTSIYGTGLIDKDQAERYSFPVTHWIMMGQNKSNYGMWSGEDVNLTYELLHKYPREKVPKQHMTELKKRLIERGFLGSIKYNIEKINHTWTDGTYHSLNKLSREPVYPNNFVRLSSGYLGTLVHGFARIEHLFILTGLLLFMKHKRNESNAFYTFAMLSLIGFFLFFILWEARSRYIVSLTPILIILSCIGHFGTSIKANNIK